MSQWLEPEISRADFDALIGGPDGMTCPSVEAGHGIHCRPGPARPSPAQPSPAYLAWQLGEVANLQPR